MNRVVSLLRGSVLLLSGGTLHANPVLQALGTAPLVTNGDPPITYTDQATASGRLGSQIFNNALITLEFDGDTGNVTGSLGFFTNTAGLFTVSVSGIGTAIFTDSMQVFDNQTATPAAAGFADQSVCCAGSVLDTFSTVFASYNLTTPIGPISGTSFIRPDLTFNTTLGGLNITSTGNSTFAAGAPVPEPNNLILVGTGVFLICYRLRRKRTTP
jgi:hypothetical protein